MRQYIKTTPSNGTVAGRECEWEKWMMLRNTWVTAGASIRRRIIGPSLPCMERLASDKGVYENKRV